MPWHERPTTSQSCAILKTGRGASDPEVPQHLQSVNRCHDFNVRPGRLGANFRERFLGITASSQHACAFPFGTISTPGAWKPQSRKSLNMFKASQRGLCCSVVRRRGSQVCPSLQHVQCRGVREWFAQFRAICLCALCCLGPGSPPT